MKERRVFLTGGTRGIGLEIATRLAREGARIAFMAKTAEPHPKLEGTLETAAAAIRDAGGEALPILGDVRAEESVEKAVTEAVTTFGGLDIVINNASAIDTRPVRDLPTKRFDLMQQVNARGTFVTIKAALPALRESDHAHILTLSPPLAGLHHWLSGTAPYTLSKAGMSMITIGTALDEPGIAANCLWPRTTIATAAIAMWGEDFVNQARKPSIMADAAYEVLRQPPGHRTGQTLIDDEVLAEAGVTDFDQYAVKPGEKHALDIFVDGWGPFAEVSA